MSGVCVTMMTTLIWFFPLLILTFDIMMSSSAPLEQHAGAIQTMPPGVSLSPVADKHIANNFFNISPFLSHTLIQAIAEESELKKRVQRYRDIEK